MSSTSKSKPEIRDTSVIKGDKGILGIIIMNLRILKDLKAKQKQDTPRYISRKTEVLNLFQRMSPEYRLNRDIIFIRGVINSEPGEPLSYIDYDTLLKVINALRDSYGAKTYKKKKKTKKKKKKSSRKKKKQSTKRR